MKGFHKGIVEQYAKKSVARECSSEKKHRQILALTLRRQNLNGSSKQLISKYANKNKKKKPGLKGFDEMLLRHSSLQRNRMNELKKKKKTTQNTQPSPRRTVIGTVSPEGKEGIIAHLLSARGLCYKETNYSCERTWRALYCIVISEAQFERGRWLESKCRKQSNKKQN